MVTVRRNQESNKNFPFDKVDTIKAIDHRKRFHGKEEGANTVYSLKGE